MLADRVIKITSDSYNIILAQWNKEVFVKVKNTGVYVKNETILHKKWDNFA